MDGSINSIMVSVISADFEALYKELERLGQGGFGSVFAGYRREDRLPVRVTPQNHTPCVSTNVSDPLHPLLTSEAVSLCLCCLGRYKPYPHGHGRNDPGGE
jgi:hypothetical protein